MKASEQIREIWQEMKELKRIRELGGDTYKDEYHLKLDIKYSEMDVLFGHESTISKAIIFYLDNQKL